MNPPTKFLTYTVPLGLAAHSRAEQLRCHQSNAAKAKQVYLNSLAVCAVQLYLQWHGFETDWENSDSYNPATSTLMDVADLIIPNYGKLECRPVLPNTEVISIPEEVWSNRLGFVCVQLHESLREATVLGFVQEITTKDLPINQLQSLDEFILYLNQFQQSASIKQPIQLSPWFQNIIEAGWETLETLLASPQPQLAFNFRRAQKASVERGKLLKLEQAGERIVLFVRLTPADDSEIDVSVEVLSAESQIELPQNLQLIILDENEKPVMQAEAGSSESLEFQFSCVPGERFSVKLVLGEAIVTELFAI
ncbi:DUF1822 family protein [Microcoleus sp. FACHB-672]|uniref:DUF1822 family protein n=1 Tax=Microcoleus sp. FACHB-672 TaxID=2692825 RepID=UPI001686550A|nr:DUF1822 family protein [Microcoleus sp. FACHB-672]MBD2042886.1 DUF1822 family protein [Microcoleus sp. FACHB-672]